MTPANPSETPPVAEAAPSKPTLEQRFAEAWINRTHRVAGRRLDPYCLHHVLLLSATSNPLGAEAVGSDARISWGDLFAAVIICTAPYGEQLDFPRFRLTWHLRVAYLSLVHRVLRRPGTALAWHCAAFRNFQNDYESQPDLFFDDEMVPGSAPGLLAKVVFLQMHLHLDDRRVWTMPIGQALFSYAAAVTTLSDARMMEAAESDLMKLLGRIQRGEVEIPSDLQPEGERPKLTPDLFGPEEAA